MYTCRNHIFFYIYGRRFTVGYFGEIFVRTSEKLGQVAAKLLGRLPMPGTNAEMALISELQASNEAVAFVEKVRPDSNRILVANMTYLNDQWLRWPAYPLAICFAVGIMSCFWGDSLQMEDLALWLLLKIGHRVSFPLSKQESLLFGKEVLFARSPAQLPDGYTRKERPADFLMIDCISNAIECSDSFQFQPGKATPYCRMLCPVIGPGWLWVWICSSPTGASTRRSMPLGQWSSKCCQGPNSDNLGS